MKRPSFRSASYLVSSHNTWLRRVGQARVKATHWTPRSAHGCVRRIFNHPARADPACSCAFSHVAPCHAARSMNGCTVRHGRPRPHLQMECRSRPPPLHGCQVQHLPLSESMHRAPRLWPTSSDLEPAVPAPTPVRVPCSREATVRTLPTRRGRSDADSGASPIATRTRCYETRHRRPRAG
jgi:hypothetical protein